VHHFEDLIKRAVADGIDGVLAWLANTAASAVIGLVVGAVVAAIVHVLPFGKKHNEKD
jgi:predicted DNA repair protein MutK